MSSISSSTSMTSFRRAQAGSQPNLDTSTTPNAPTAQPNSSLFTSSFPYDSRLPQYLSPLLMAAQNGDEEMLIKLIKAGQNINQKEHSDNALMLAARNSKTNIIKILIANNVNLDEQNETGTTALMIAAHDGQEEIVKVLIDAGAQVNLQDDFGETALMRTARYGHTQAAKVLLDNKADQSIKSKVGSTALTLATQNNHREIINLLSGTSEKL